MMAVLAHKVDSCNFVLKIRFDAAGPILPKMRAKRPG